jgi:membrane protein required for colicin V production
MPPFNWFDVVLFIILASSIAAGFKAGFTRVVIHLVATIVGLLAAFWCYRLVGTEILPHVNGNVQAANAIGFGLIFVGVMLLGSLISLVLSRLFRWIGLSWFNHLLGGFAGVVRGAVIATVLVDILVAFTKPPPPAYLDQSRLLPYVNEFGGWVIDVAPFELRKSFDDQMDRIRGIWETRPDRSKSESHV